MSIIARVLTLMAALCAGSPIEALAGGAPSPSPRSRTADPAIVRALQDHRWTLQSATDSAGQPIDTLLPPGHPFVMSFDGARLSIKGGCNQLVGSWRLHPTGQMSMGRLAGTMMACDEPLMQADAALSGLLAQPLTVALTRGPTPVLRLSTPAQQVLSFSGQPTLRSLYGAPKRVFLEVAAQTAQCSQPSATAGSCLQVRELRFDGKGLRKDPPGPWRPFDGSIEGFTHTPGVRNVLRIDRYERKPAPADGPAAVYVLDLVVESETVAGK